MTEKLKIFVSREDGNIHTDFEGFKGKSCLTEAEEIFKILDELGIKTNSREFTPKTELNQKEVSKNVTEH